MSGIGCRRAHSANGWSKKSTLMTRAIAKSSHLIPPCTLNHAGDEGSSPNRGGRLLAARCSFISEGLSPLPSVSNPSKPVWGAIGEFVVASATTQTANLIARIRPLLHETKMKNAAQSEGTSIRATNHSPSNRNVNCPRNRVSNRWQMLSPNPACTPVAERAASTRTNRLSKLGKSPTISE